MADNTRPLRSYCHDTPHQINTNKEATQIPFPSCTPQLVNANKEATQIQLQCCTPQQANPNKGLLQLLWC
ncbi:hypothetical protein J6590_087926 [Homalodisca vitripennis]|nr:hypothetical protein J6590_087926 [Homalodisca vitripennis]